MLPAHQASPSCLPVSPFGSVLVPSLCQCYWCCSGAQAQGRPLLLLSVGGLLRCPLPPSPTNSALLQRARRLEGCQGKVEGMGRLQPATRHARYNDQVNECVFIIRCGHASGTMPCLPRLCSSARPSFLWAGIATTPHSQIALVNAQLCTRKARQAWVSQMIAQESSPEMNRDWYAFAKRLSHL